MIRTKTKKPDAILCGDFHLRESTPICRTDDFWEAQWRKVARINQLQGEYDCPVIHSGDLFDHWKPSPYLLSMAIQYLPEQFWTVYGNHDLPQHSLELDYKCGTEVLARAGKVIVAEGNHWGQSLEKETYFMPGSMIGIWHVMTYQGKAPWPGCTDLTARQILEKYPQFDLIVTGHNHKSFVERLNGRLLVNPGSLTRQTADQEDHIPMVYLYYADTNTVTPHILTYEKGVISREHIDRVEQRNERLTAFVEMLSEEWEEGISFEENLERFYQANNIRKSVMDIIRKAVE